MQHKYVNKSDVGGTQKLDSVSRPYASKNSSSPIAGMPHYLLKSNPYLQRQSLEEEKDESMQIKPALSSIQTKLTVSQPNDPYEKEADHVAGQVMSMPDASVQRQPMEEEEEEEEVEKPIQPKSISSAITPFQTPSTQRQPIADEEELIQPESNTGMASQITSGVAQDIHSIKGTGQPLPAFERAFFEPRFGRDFSNVRVHTDNRAANTAQSINARAFTLGHDVVFGTGQYSPGSNSGRLLLAHELTHIVQQNSGIDSGIKKEVVPFIGNERTARRLKQVGDRGTNIFTKNSGTKLSDKISRQSIKDRVQRHLSINNAVTEFKSKVSNTSLLKKGQFYWSYELKSVIKNKYQTILNASWLGASKITLQNYLDRLLALSYAPRRKSVEIARLRRKIIRFLLASGNSTAADIKKIVGTGYYGTRKTGTFLFQSIWNKYKSLLAIPSLTQFARLDKLQGLSLFEYIACWSAAERVSKFFIAKGGYSIGARSAGAKIGGIALCRRVRRDNTDVGGYKKGDVVTYYSNLGSVITKIKSSLDDGYHIHARVLSGIYSGTKPSCKQEHSINIIGYDGNKFVFWDPDSTESSRFGGGFGFLYYDGVLRRLTTAQNDADLRVDSSGDHMGGSQHRYQVLTVRTI